ncbi:hypothetical protein RI129_008749 [Pyrocoelia pectoralis]|uniref:Cytosol aminopeptidase n=1 Tax=Pyrocoelia pectoralis TaxID=417401 RepID=A0AAN7V7V9_9COLE
MEKFLLRKFLRIYFNLKGSYVRTITCKRLDDPCADPKYRKAIVLGLYCDPDEPDDPGKFTPIADRYNRMVNCKLFDIMKYVGPLPKKGDVRIFYNLDDEYHAIALVGLGKECQGYDVFEQIDEGKETIRIAAARGCQALQELQITKVMVESFGHAESAAEGAALGVWLYQEKKSMKDRVYIPHLELYDDCDWTGWQIGLQKAAAQNLARQLSDTPANLMTPTSFAQNAVEVLCKSGVNVEVKVKGWAETQKMYAFMAASQGSCEPPIFMELSYYGASKDERPVVMIGKGITYNSGGLCEKSCLGQALMRGDMAGAASVVAACRAVAALQLPLNIRCLIPMCENMPGCSALKPGDIVKAMNGKSIFIQDTDCAGRLVMADAFVYAQNFWPRFIISVGTMTPEAGFTLGASSCAGFSNSEALWDYMLAASMHTGDRIWRFPLYNCYKQSIRAFENCDTKTIGRSPDHTADLCNAAAFLQEFLPCGDWLHIDSNGTKWSDGISCKYLRTGMSGRPTRTLVEFLSQLVCHRE